MKWNKGTQFENPPSGSHVARCYAVIDLGTQPHTWQGETKLSRDVRISFELPGELMEGKYNPEHKGKPFSVHLTAKQSLHPKARLRAVLAGWRGKDFTPEEAAAFDPRKLVGAACRVTLVENGDYVNIASISPLGKGEKCPKAVNKGMFFSLEPDEFDLEVYNELGEKTREKIAASPEFKALEGGGTDAEGPQADPPEQHDDDVGF